MISNQRLLLTSRGTLFRLEYEMKNCGSSSSNIAQQEEGNDELIKMINPGTTLRMQLSPNPVTDQYLTVQLDGISDEAKEMMIQVNDLQGRPLKTVHIEGNAHSQERRRLDLADLEAGTYVISVLVSGKILLSEMFVKLHNK